LAPVTKRRLLRACAALLGGTGVLAAEAFGLATEPKDSGAWVPALAALGDTVARSDQRPEGAAVYVVPVLLGAGVDAGASGAQAAAAGAVDSGPTAGRETRDETERWVPALAFISGVLGQGTEGSVNTDSTVTYRYVAQDSGTVVPFVQPPGQQARIVPFITDFKRSLREGKGEGFNAAPNIPPPGVLITGVTNPPQVLPVAGDDVYLTPFVGASLEMMTPGVQPVPGRPRLFVHGDASLGFAFDRPVAKEGVPEGAVVPQPTEPVFSEVQIKGIGSKTSGEVQTLLLSGGLGAAFTVDAWERRLRIKPSFEYMRENIQVTGRLIRAFRKDTGLRGGVRVGVGAGQITTTLAPAQFLSVIDLQATDTRSFHGIGPGLEIEMDAARAGPVMLTLFLTGRAYKMLGDLDVELEATQTLTDPELVGGSQTVAARFDFNIHSWSYLGALGLRFRWLPED
jgi:hypothetical protein